MSIKKGIHITLWAGNALLTLLYFIPMAEPPAILQFFGRLHPLVLHFPIVLLLIAFLFEVYAHKKPHWQEPAVFLLAAGAATAYASALAGFLLSVGDSYSGQTFEAHKWLGLATTWLATVLYTGKGYLTSKKVYLPLYGLACLVLIITGHMGANLTHGEGFLTAVFEDKQSGMPGPEVALFEGIVQPILEEKCVSCHNPNKQKGELQLTTAELLAKGGKSGKVLVAGDPAGSKLISYLHLPINDDLHMPPKGKVQLTQEEIEILSWWVAEGASFEETLGNVPAEAPIQATFISHFGTDIPYIDFAAESILEELNAEVIAVKPIAEDSPYLDAYLGNRKELSLSTLKKLREVSDQLFSLDMGSSPVTERMVDELSRHENLHKLYLDNTQIDDDAIASLRKLSRLEYLNLYSTAVTQKGINRLLDKLPSLKSLYLWQTGIAENEIEALQNRYPSVKIDGGIRSDSFFATAQLVPPVISFKSVFFSDSTTIEASYRLANANVYYQIDEGPLQVLEGGKLTIDRSARVNFLARKEGWEDSEIRTETFVKINQPGATKRSLQYAPKGAYTAKGVSTIFDLRKGSENFRDGEWLGFNGDDMVAEVTLNETQQLSSVYISTLDDTGSWIFPPTKLEVWAGSGNNAMRKVSELDLESPIGPQPKNMTIHQLKFEKQQVKQLKVIARNYGNLPDWHPGKGTPAWLFIDEIAFQ